jgi:hypothetical protein
LSNGGKPSIRHLDFLAVTSYQRWRRWRGKPILYVQRGRVHMAKHLLRKITEMVAPGRGGAKRGVNELKGVDAYWRQLTPAEIAAGEHKKFVGGLWD